jgi:hypothetical protein
MDSLYNSIFRPAASPGRFLLVLSLGLAGLGQIFLTQSGQAWTLLPGLGLMLGAVGLTQTFARSREPLDPPLSPRTEIIWIVLILLAGLFFRLYRLDSLPSGMNTDQGLLGFVASRIAFEGLRPLMEAFHYTVPELLIYYQLAGWLKLWGSSYITFHLFFVFLSMASFPFI